VLFLMKKSLNSTSLLRGSVAYQKLFKFGFQKCYIEILSLINAAAMAMPQIRGYLFSEFTPY